MCLKRSRGIKKKPTIEQIETKQSPSKAPRNVARTKYQIPLGALFGKSPLGTGAQNEQMWKQMVKNRITFAPTRPPWLTTGEWMFWFPVRSPGKYKIIST